MNVMRLNTLDNLSLMIFLMTKTCIDSVVNCTLKRTCCAVNSVCALFLLKLLYSKHSVLPSILHTSGPDIE